MAARQAAHSLAFEEAALWFDRAATLPETAGGRAGLSCRSRPRTNHVRAGDFARAREIYERLTTMPDPLVRLQAAMGREEADARPGLADSRTADLLTGALADCGLDPDDLRYVRALGSLGPGAGVRRADRARAARWAAGRSTPPGAAATGRPSSTRCKTSLWHGLTPDVASTQLARSTELAQLCTEAGDREILSMASYFRAVVSYLAGRPDDLAEATADLRRAAESHGQPWHNYFAGCLAQGRAFCAGDFAQAEQRAAATLQLGEAFGVDTPRAPTACRCS